MEKPYLTSSGNASFSCSTTDFMPCADGWFFKAQAYSPSPTTGHEVNAGFTTLYMPVLPTLVFGIELMTSINNIAELVGSPDTAFHSRQDIERWAGPFSIIDLPAARFILVNYHMDAPQNRDAFCELVILDYRAVRVDMTQLATREDITSLAASMVNEICKKRIMAVLSGE